MATIMCIKCAKNVQINICSFISLITLCNHVCENCIYRPEIDKMYIILIYCNFFATKKKYRIIKCAKNVKINIFATFFCNNVTYVQLFCNFKVKQEPKM